VSIHYLDNASTTAVLPSAAKAALEAMTESYGNPSSLHKMGFEAERIVEDARAVTAAALGVDKGEIYFTSGGSASNSIALLGAARATARRGKHVVISAIEHESTLLTAAELQKEGFEVTFVPPSPDGRVSASDIISSLTEKTTLVSLMSVNNETGLTQPVSTLLPILNKKGILLHTDAVQAFLKTPVPKADLISLSGHKIHAPKGIGVLRVRKGVRLSPVLCGSQQSSVFPGTESVPLIAAFAAAVREQSGKTAEHKARIAELKKSFLSRFEGTVISSGDDSGIVLIDLAPYNSETVIHFLAARDIYVSAGSACTKGRPSHVLEAMGRASVSAIRISFSQFNTLDDVDALLKGLSDAASLRHR